MGSRDNYSVLTGRKKVTSPIFEGGFPRFRGVSLNANPHFPYISSRILVVPKRLNL